MRFNCRGFKYLFRFFHLIDGKAHVLSLSNWIVACDIQCPDTSLLTLFTNTEWKS